jgi:hypothetical protein
MMLGTIQIIRDTLGGGGTGRCHQMSQLGRGGLTNCHVTLSKKFSPNHKMTQEGGGGVKNHKNQSKKCHVLFEWPLISSLLYDWHLKRSRMKSDSISPGTFGTSSFSSSWFEDILISIWKKNFL